MTADRSSPPADRTTARTFTVVEQLHPRFRDTDAMGHINNAVYISYLEVARQAYWRALFGSSKYRDVPFILARVECDFRSEAMQHEVLELHIRCAWVGTKSFAFEYEVREQTTQRLAVAARTVQVCYDYATKQSLAMPAALRAALERFEGRSLARVVPE